MWRQWILLSLFVAQGAYAVTPVDPMLSTGRQPDTTTKALSEIRAAEKRRVPLDIQLQLADTYDAGGPIEVTVTLTNLFEDPLTINSRMLVNHPRLQGEVAFQILGPDGQNVEFQRLITPLTLRDQDFVTLTRGQSIQRSVDLADLYGIIQKGTYKVRVFYHNDVDHIGVTEHAWKGMVGSDWAEIHLQ